MYYFFPKKKKKNLTLMCRGAFIMSQAAQFALIQLCKDNAAVTVQTNKHKKKL